MRRIELTEHLPEPMSHYPYGVDVVAASGFLCISGVLRDMAGRQAINTVRRYSGDARPVSTRIEVSALAHPDALAEIEAIAQLSSRDGGDA